MEEKIVNQSVTGENDQKTYDWAVKTLLKQYVLRVFDISIENATHAPCAYYNIYNVENNGCNTFIKADIIFKTWDNDKKRYDYSVSSNQEIPLTNASFGTIIEKRAYNRELKKWKNSQLVKIEALYNLLYNDTKKTKRTT